MSFLPLLWPSSAVRPTKACAARSSKMRGNPMARTTAPASANHSTPASPASPPDHGSASPRVRPATHQLEMVRRSESTGRRRARLPVRNRRAAPGDTLGVLRRALVLAGLPTSLEHGDELHGFDVHRVGMLRANACAATEGTAAPGQAAFRSLRTGAPVRHELPVFLDELVLLLVATAAHGEKDENGYEQTFEGSGASHHPSKAIAHTRGAVITYAVAAGRIRGARPHTQGLQRLAVIVPNARRTDRIARAVRVRGARARAHASLESEVGFAGLPHVTIPCAPAALANRRHGTRRIAARIVHIP